MAARSVLIQYWNNEGALVARDTCGAESLELSASANERVLELARNNVRRALNGESFTVPAHIDGRLFELSLRPLRTQTGQPSGAASVLVDVSDRARLEEELSERVAFERLVSGLSSHFWSIRSDEIDDGIHHALAQIGSFASVDRAYIFRFSSDGTTMINTHEWCAEGVEPQIDNLQAVPIEAVPWWTERLRKRETIHVPRVADLPEEAAGERDILEAQDILSVLVVPMVHGQSVVGFLGFDAVRAPKAWPIGDIVLLRMVGEMFVAALERKRAVELEAQLNQARSIENVARLAGGVAHDFNNLLAVVLNCSTILRRQLLDPEHIQFVDDIYESAKRAADLTRHLLQIGRRGVTEPVVLDLNTIVVGLAPLLSRTLGEHVELATELGVDVGLVRIGLPQFEQILVNLTVNARDAMLRGGKLEIRTTNEHLDDRHARRFLDVKPGPHVVLSVKDTGSGMTPEVAARAFEPFFTTKGTRGTGLGLSTVYGIVKQAGGHVALTTEPGEGTTVFVYLPLIEDATAVPSSREPERIASPLGRGETVLVVEDSASLRLLVRGVLTANRYRVVDAETPIDALSVCQRHGGAIDLLLTDVILPQMSGKELASRARDEYGIHRVLYMSGYDDDVVAHQGVLEPGTHLLQKPFLEADLLREVRRVLDGGAGAS
ncbi:MAG: response regulator [Polyangiaceae bacterium]|nr:response regulator [Polyangiaceae bacterium]